MTGFTRLFSRCGFAALALSAAFAAAAAAPASAQQTVRIALPTKTYFPTIIAETAVRQKLFEKEGLKAELTVYRGGAEAFEAVAAGAADITLGSCAIVAAGINKGVKTKAISGSGLGYNGWYLMVKADSKIQNVSELAGKKVGITSAGSGSDMLARWTTANRKVEFTRVPLGTTELDVGTGSITMGHLLPACDATGVPGPRTCDIPPDEQL